jgi:hypothetical protein
MAKQAANPTAAPYATRLWPICISGRLARVTNSIRKIEASLNRSRRCLAADASEY